MAVVAGRGVASGRSDPDVTSGRKNNDVSQREDLANFISMITRDETPFMSSIGKTKATAIYHEWQTDQLNSPGDSRIGEGTDYQIPVDLTSSFLGLPQQTGQGATNVNSVGQEFATTGPNRQRLGNYTQINGKTIAVSGTRRAIDQAGVADEYAYQLKKRGTELRRDVEMDLVHTYRVQSSAGRRSFGGYQSWINDGAVVEIAGSGPVAPLGQGAGNALNTATGVISNNLGDRNSANAGTGTFTLTGAASVDRGALSLSDIDSVMQNIYEEGGKATKIMLSPKLRRDFSDLMVTDSGVRRNIDMDGKLRQSVDVYMSDFGDLMVVPNYIMGLSFGIDSSATGNFTPSGTTSANTYNTANSAALIYDPMWFNIATLRPLQEVDVGQRGDSTVGMMVEECTLEVRNPIGCGAIYNLE